MILDTNAVSALLGGSSTLEALLSVEPQHHLPVVVIGEYRYGLLGSRLRDQLGELLGRLIAESVILRIDETTAEAYARLRQELRAAGKPIPENDVWIAALARQHGLPVVSNDGHFDHVPGLQRLRWK